MADSTLCSDWSRVAASNASRAWQVRYAVSGLTTDGCQISDTLEVALEATSVGLAKVVVTGAEYDVPNGFGGRRWAYHAGPIVPADATQTRNVSWTISWTAAETSGLSTVSGTTQTLAIGCFAAVS